MSPFDCFGKNRRNQKAIEKGLLYMLFGRLQDELEAALEHRVMVTAFTYKKSLYFIESHLRSSR